MEKRLLKLQNNIANLVCGGLLLLLFIFMCVSSYKDYKQQKVIPERIEKLEEQVKELSRKVKEKVNEPLLYQEVKLPHPSREMAKVPIIDNFDRVSCMTSCIVWDIFYD